MLAACSQQPACCFLQGFVDPHVHLIFGGLSLSQVSLRGASSRQEVAARVAAAAAAAADGEWLLGGGWSEADWGGGLPDASWVDEVRQYSGSSTDTAV
jgi:predicted amidohydrolase YtcJ